MPKKKNNVIVVTELLCIFQVPKENTAIENEDNKSYKVKEKNIFNIKAVQTAFSTIDIHTTKCKFCEIRSKSQEELTRVTKKHEIFKRKDTALLDLNPVVTEWFEIHRDKVKVKMWGDKMQKLADKLKTPGGEEKLRMKIEKYLKKVPDQFSDGDDDRQEYRKQLPDDIIRKLKLKYLNPTEPDVNVYRLELSKYCSRFKTENFKKVITNWLKNLNIKKKDFLGRSVKKDDVLMYITEKLEPIVLNRPSSDAEYKNALRSNIIDIVQELPLVIGRHNKDYVVNRVTDGLVNDILSIESKLPSSYIQPTVTEIKEFVKDEITFFLEKAHKAISTKRMDCLETELVDLLLDLSNASDIDNYIVEDITAIFKETAKLSEYKARYFSNILLRDYKEFFFRQTFFNDKSKIGTGHPEVCSEIQNPGDIDNEEYASYNIYMQQLIEEINKWICKINIPNKNRSFVGVVVKELASDIVDRHKYLEMNPNSKRTDAEEFELLKYEIFKWTSKLTGDDNTTVLDNAQELLDKINTIPKPVTAVSLPQTPDVPGDTKPNLETLSDLICDWFEELPEEVYQYANLNSDLVKDLAKDILQNYDNIYPGLIETMIDQWIDNIFNRKLNRNDGEKLKNRIRNKIQRHAKENEKKDPRQEKVVIRAYEDIVDDWIDTVPMDPKRVRHFIKTRNEHIHELALRIYQMKTKYIRAPNEIKVKVLQEGITDWMKKLPLNSDARTSLNEKGNRNKYASKLASKIQACKVDGSSDLRAALKEQLIAEQIKVAMMDWLKKLVLYINNNPKIKEHQETIIKELAVKLNEHIRDGNNPEGVMYDYIKMLDPSQSDDFIRNTVSQLKLHLQTYKFEDISLQLNDSDVLMSNIETWIENLHLDVRDIQRFNDQKMEFINSMQRLRSSGTDVAVIKKEIITFLKSILLVNNNKIDENTLNRESLKLLKCVSTIQAEDVPSTSTPIDNELICKTVKDWANTLPLKPIYCPRELRWFIDDISSAMTSIFERLEYKVTKDNEHVINREIISCLRRFPLLEQTTEKFIMKASKELSDKLRVMNVVRLEDSCNDDARNVAVYGVALDRTNTTNTTDNTDITMESIKEDDIQANLERYSKQVVRHITDWFDGLNLPNMKEPEFKEVVINDLAGDIIDRHKYLELNPESRSTREDEVEHLRYQIFKWINKLVGEGNLETIEHAENLMARIQSIPVPMLVKPSSNVTKNRINMPVPACCIQKKYPTVLTSPNCCRPSYNNLPRSDMPYATQPAPNVYPGDTSTTSNATDYSIEEVSGYTIDPMSTQATEWMSSPPGPPGTSQTGPPSFSTSPQPTDKRANSPSTSPASPQPGRYSFSTSSQPTDKWASSPTALTQPDRYSFSTSSQPTDKWANSPTASPQPGRSSFSTSSQPTDKWASSPTASPGSPQLGRSSFSTSPQLTDKRTHSPSAPPGATQTGRSNFSTSPEPTDKWMNSPSASEASPDTVNFSTSPQLTDKRPTSPSGPPGTTQTGRSNFSTSPQPTEKWTNSPSVSPTSSQRGRTSFSISPQLTDKRTSSPSSPPSGTQPGRSNFSTSPQPTDKWTNSPSASPTSSQRGRTSFSTSPQPTDTRTASPSGPPGTAQPGRSNFSTTPKTTDKWKNSPSVSPTSSQPGRSSPQPTDKRTTSPSGPPGGVQPGRSNFSTTPQPTDKWKDSPSASQTSPQPGNFSSSPQPTGKRMDSPSNSPGAPQSGSSSFSSSSQPTDKRSNSPTASQSSPQPGRSSLSTSPQLTDKRVNSPYNSPGGPQSGRSSLSTSSQPSDKWVGNPNAAPASPQPGRSGFNAPSEPSDKGVSSHNSSQASQAAPQTGRSNLSTSPQPTDKWTNSPSAPPVSPQSGGSSVSAYSHTEKRTGSPTALGNPNTEQYRHGAPPASSASTGVSPQPSDKQITNPDSSTNPDKYNDSPNTKPPPVKRSVAESPHAGRVSAGKRMASPENRDTQPSQPTGKRVNSPNANKNYRSETPPPGGVGTIEVLKPQSMRRMSNSGTSAIGETPISSSGSSSGPAGGVGTLELLSPQSAKRMKEGSRPVPPASRPVSGMPVQPTDSKLSSSNASGNSNAIQNNPQAQKNNNKNSTGDSPSNSSRIVYMVSPSGNGGATTPPPPPPTPQDGTKEAIYEKYQKIFKEKCDALPIESTTPETEKLAELARTGIYNGIVKTFFKLKADPEIENDYGYFEFMLEEKIDDMLDVLPQTENFKSKRHPWKIDVLTNAIDMLEELHGLSDRPSFRQRVRNKFNRKFARELELEECFLLQQGFLAEMADAYILDTKYKDENPVKANIYKNRLMKKIDDLTNHLSKEHNAGFRFFKKPQLARIAMKVLDEVPIPNDDILKAEAEEIQLADEVEKWYRELPTKPLVNETDGVLRKRMIDLLAKKLYDIQKHGDDSNVPKDEQMKHEMSQFLEKRAKLQDDQDLNINFMVDELNNRLKNRWLKDPVDYSDFENEHPVSSTFAQVNNHEVYLAPLMDAATSTGQPQGQNYQDSPYESSRNRQPQSAQMGPNQTYNSQGVPMDMRQQQPYLGYGPPGYAEQSYKGVPFQSIPPNQPPGHQTGMGPYNTRLDGYGPQQPQMRPGNYPESYHHGGNNPYMPQQGMHPSSRPGPLGPPGPGNGYMTHGPPMQHTCPRNMRLGPQSGPSPRMHCSIPPYVQCGGRQGSFSQEQGTEPGMNGQQRAYGLQGQMRQGTNYARQGQNPTPGYEGGYGPPPGNGVGAPMGPGSPDGEDIDNEYMMRCKCLEAYRRRRRCFEFDERCPRYSPYRCYF
ncbi:uncharacterized protein LOC113500064 isoform X3 [Trichoplusia ni]|uniref:Uncharacterized protein LOC113500064 isoform X3 n=1 Tax=Trichoplusia ni TaxID=7111 RepID=A0A7E5W8J6_TRINI|nr:uncharacterized protein LOC113500064 isoform X3 [Trichoplusia ni]